MPQKKKSLSEIKFFLDLHKLWYMSNFFYSFIHPQEVVKLKNWRRVTCCFLPFQCTPIPWNITYNILKIKLKNWQGVTWYIFPLNLRLFHKISLLAHWTLKRFQIRCNTDQCLIFGNSVCPFPIIPIAFKKISKKVKFAFIFRYDKIIWNVGFHIRNLFDKTWQEADGWGRESLCKVTGLPGNKEFIAHNKILRPECNVKDGYSVVVFFINICIMTVLVQDFF